MRMPPQFRRLRNHRFAAVFAAPRRPRAPLLRFGLGLIGVSLLLVLLVAGLFVGLAMLAGGLLLRLWRQRGQPIARPAALEGVFRVLQRPSLPLAR